MKFNYLVFIDGYIVNSYKSFEDAVSYLFSFLLSHIISLYDSEVPGFRIFNKETGEFLAYTNVR